MTYYIYALTDLRLSGYRRVFYVGATTMGINRKFRAYGRSFKGPDLPGRPVLRRIYDIIVSGGNFGMVLLAKVETKEEAVCQEARWVAYYRDLLDLSLTNRTRGGQGGGHQPDAEELEKRSDGILAAWACPERRARQSAIARAAWTRRKGQTNGA